MAFVNPGLLASKALVLAFCVVGVLGTGAALMGADGAATAPGTAPATAARGIKGIALDIQKVQAELVKGGTWPGFAALGTAQGREKFAERLKDPLVKLAGLQDEMSAWNPALSMSPPGGSKVYLQGIRIQYLAMAGSMGSEEAGKQLAGLAASGDKELAAEGKMGQSLVAWLLANKDEAAEGKVLEGIEALAKANPESEAVATNLRTIRMIPGLSPELLARIDDLYMKTLKGDVARGMQTYLDAGAKQKAAVGKAMVLAGKTSEGKDFSTKEYAGKVVLVDFWATWCGPCIKELPRVKEMYTKYHEQGLEIVGISCDGDGERLAKYTKDNGMPWVQLWDKEKQGGKGEAWHALAAEWKVNGIPQMFLIDRNGVLRTVRARQEMEKLIPKLIEEKVGGQ